MKRFISIVMVLALVLLLGGCGASEKDALLGAWKAEMDMTDLFNTSMVQAAEDEFADYLKVEDFTVYVTLTFHENDTYSMEVDEDALTDTMENVRSDLQTGLEQYLVDTVAAAGVEMSLEDILAFSGLSMDDLMDEIVNQELTDSMVEGIASEGKFKVEDGKLFLSAGLEYEVDKNTYEPYTLEGATLTLLDIVSNEEVDEFTKALYPMTFNKIS